MTRQLLFPHVHVRTQPCQVHVHLYSSCPIQKLLDGSLRILLLLKTAVTTHQWTLKSNNQKDCTQTKSRYIHK